MALYSDKWWLLSHIQHSFVISDSTGHSEQVMTASDKAFTDSRIRQMAKEEGTHHMLAGLGIDTDDEDEESQEGAAAASYDILLGTKHHGFHRPRSNTELKLDKLKIANRSKDEETKSKVKVIKWRVVEGAEEEEEEGKKGRKEPTVEELEELFPIKETDEEEEEDEDEDAFEEVEQNAEESGDAIARTQGARPKNPPLFKSRISQQLETMPPPPENPFKEYAKFAGVNGAALQGAKSINIFLGMDPDRDFPMPISVVSDAKVQDVIGYACWQYTAAGRIPKLKPDVDKYALYIADPDGTIEFDFSELDRREPISKFGFGYLGLMEMTDDDDAEGAECKRLITVYLPDGNLTILELESRHIPLRALMEQAFTKRPHSAWSSELRHNYGYNIEKVDEPGVPLDQDKFVSQYDTTQFYIVRANSQRRRDDTAAASPSSAAVAAAASGGREPADLVLESTVGYQEYNDGVMLLSRKHKANRKYKAKFEVVLAISEEKIEVHPKSQPSGTTRFWSKQKSLVYNTDSLVACINPIKRPNGKVLLELVLAERPNRSSDQAEGDHDSSISQLQQLQASFSSSPDQYVVKKHDFECKEEDGVAISTRLNHILHWRPNDARHWYLRNSSAK